MDNMQNSAKSNSSISKNGTTNRKSSSLSSDSDDISQETSSSSSDLSDVSQEKSYLSSDSDDINQELSSLSSYSSKSNVSVSKSNVGVCKSNTSDDSDVSDRYKDSNRISSVNTNTETIESRQEQDSSASINSSTNIDNFENDEFQEENIYTNDNNHEISDAQEISKHLSFTSSSYKTIVSSISISESTISGNSEVGDFHKNLNHISSISISPEIIESRQEQDSSASINSSTNIDNFENDEFQEENIYTDDNNHEISDNQEISKHLSFTSSSYETSESAQVRRPIIQIVPIDNGTSESSFDISESSVEVSKSTAHNKSQQKGWWHNFNPNSRNRLGYSSVPKSKVNSLESTSDSGYSISMIEEEPKQKQLTPYEESTYEEDIKETKTNNNLQSISSSLNQAITGVDSLRRDVSTNTLDIRTEEANPKKIFTLCFCNCCFSRSIV